MSRNSLRRTLMATTVLAAVALLPSVASARSWPITDAKVAVAVPSTWNVQAGVTELMATPPDGSALLRMHLLAETDLATAQKNVARHAARYVKELKLRVRRDATIHGMKGWLGEGEGSMDGTAVSVSVLLVQTPGGRILMGLGFGPKTQYDRQRKAIAGIFASVKPKR